MDEPRRLYRSETDKMLAGVCGGLGEFFGVDPTLIRIAFVILALAGGAGVPLYLAMWVVVPRASRVGSPGVEVARDAADEVRETVQKGAEQAKQAYERWRRERGEDSPTEAGTVPPPPATEAPGAPEASGADASGAADTDEAAADTDEAAADERG